MKIYCLSGLGIDRRAFQNIVPKGVELIHIDWIDPQPNETLKQYSERLFDLTKPEDNYNIIGLSFGGMVAAEFSKIKQANKLFLISTINSKNELPTYFKFGYRIGLHKMIPTILMQKGSLITNYLFGINTKKEKEFINAILKDVDPNFIKWAIKAISNWDNPVKPLALKIHGSNDQLLPLKSSAEHIIQNAGHFMIYNRGQEITAIIEKEMNESANS